MVTARRLPSLTLCALVDELLRADLAPLAAVDVSGFASSSLLLLLLLFLLLPLLSAASAASGSAVAAAKTAPAFLTGRALALAAALAPALDPGRAARCCRPPPRRCSPSLLRPRTTITTRSLPFPRSPSGLPCPHRPLPVVVAAATAPDGSPFSSPLRLDPAPACLLRRGSRRSSTTRPTAPSALLWMP